MEAMTRFSCALGLALVCAVVQASGATPQRLVASGKADGAVPAWTITAEAPAGWTADCCTYARAIGVDAVLYRGEWSGKPDRVMVLNVWPAKLASLDAELQADRKRYLQRDPAAKVERLDIAQPQMVCMANVFEGTDRLDDIVVFCDPGKASGIRLSWSMTLADGDTLRRPLLAALMGVIGTTAYRSGRVAPTAIAVREKH